MTPMLVRLGEMHRLLAPTLQIAWELEVQRLFLHS